MGSWGSPIAQSPHYTPSQHLVTHSAHPLPLLLLGHTTPAMPHILNLTLPGPSSAEPVSPRSSCLPENLPPTRESRLLPGYCPELIALGGGHTVIPITTIIRPRGLLLHTQDQNEAKSGRVTRVQTLFPTVSSTP